jgi:hypothetical protein
MSHENASPQIRYATPETGLSCNDLCLAGSEPQRLIFKDPNSCAGSFIRQAKTQQPPVSGERNLVAKSEYLNI